MLGLGNGGYDMMHFLDVLPRGIVNGYGVHVHVWNISIYCIMIWLAYVCLLKSIILYIYTHLISIYLLHM